MTNLVRWNPLRELQDMNTLVDRFFDEPFFRSRFDREHTWRMPLDAYMTDDAIIITAELPGILADDVNITLENGVLTISGKLNPRQEDHEYFLRERFAGRFERMLSVGTPVDIAKAEAVFDNGILTLTLPKAEEVKPRTIAIKKKK
jgi:HSP20 family protein